MEFGNLPIRLVTNKMQSSLLHLVIILSAFLFSSSEAYFILHRWKPLYHLLPVTFFLAFLAFERFLSKPSPVYLVDFSCLRPPKRCRVPTSNFIEHSTILKCFDEDSLEFLARTMTASGQGNETYLPPQLHCLPPKVRHEDSIEEAQMLYCPVLDDLLYKTKLSPHDIDILIVNCSGFCPSPSLTSIIVNRYAMRTDIKTLNLSGMGCSAGSIGIDLARKLLHVHKNSNAILISGEIVSTGWYSGKDRSKLLLNCSFRMGSSAVLLTNRKDAKEISKYKLVHVVRRQTASDDMAYSSGIREEDSEGITGFSMKRHLPQVANEALHMNIAALSAVILPFQEKIRYIISMMKKGGYVPNFESVIQHYCIPGPGLKLVREIRKGLRLEEEATEGAVATVQRFGNLSSASLWYQLAYTEAKGRVKKGDRVWQLWMGSGIKGGSVVLECQRNLDCGDERRKGPWFDCIDRYPI